MGQLKGFTLKKAEGGLGRIASTKDNLFLVVAAMAVTGTQLTHGEAKSIIQLKDAEALGITESFDANQKVLTHYHLSEIFRLAPESQIILLPVAVGKMQDSTAQIVKTIRANKQIKGVGLFGFTNDLSTIASDVEELQTQIVEALKPDGILIDFVLVEGRGKEGLEVNNFADLKEKNAPQVSVIIAQDKGIAAVDDAYKYHASIGSALGMLSVRNVSENLGSVDIENKPENAKGGNTYPLTDEGKKRYISAGISTGQSAEELSNEQLKLLNDKGYILAGQYADMAGFFLSNSPTCVSKSSDYTYIENNRVWNKAARLVRQTLSPRIKSKLPKNPQTGYLKDSIVTSLQELAGKAIERQMVVTGEISGYAVSIDAKQTVTEEMPLKVKIRLVPDDILHAIEGEIGLTSNL
jgi:hypothetical protein